MCIDNLTFYVGQSSCEGARDHILKLDNTVSQITVRERCLNFKIGTCCSLFFMNFGKDSRSHSTFFVEIEGCVSQHNLLSYKKHNIQKMEDVTEAVVLYITSVITKCTRSFLSWWMPKVI